MAAQFASAMSTLLAFNVLLYIYFWDTFIIKGVNLEIIGSQLVYYKG